MKGSYWAQWLLPGLIAASCAGQRPPQPEPAPPPLFSVYAIPTGSDEDAREMDERFAAFRAAFDRAVALYDEKEYESAAEAFIAAAPVILVERGHWAWEIMARNRWNAYRNAQLAWRRAGRLDKARAALTAAAESDSLCADKLRRLVAELDRTE